MSEVTQIISEHQTAFRIVVSIVILIVGFFLGPVVRNAIVKMKGKHIDKGLVTFTASLASTFIRFLAALIALAQLGVNMDVIVAGLSAVGLGISLALKENMANVAGGMQILLTRPFVVGDYIGIEGEEGSVKKIEIMFTTMETPNGQEVIVPNSTLVSKTILNFTENKKRRIVIDVPVSSEGSYEQFRQEMVKTMGAEPKVYASPAPVTAVNGFTPSGNGMIIRCMCYCDNTDYWEVYYDLNEKMQILRTQLKLTPPVSITQVVEK
ncbi:MAG: mechanosensitive ion channel [Erysipelotrichaceae bacterium]|nr:mechanosensitive ion channel [Erysipelotrichaceae bacterium]